MKLSSLNYTYEHNRFIPFKRYKKANTGISQVLLEYLPGPLLFIIKLGEVTTANRRKD